MGVAKPVVSMISIILLSFGVLMSMDTEVVASGITDITAWNGGYTNFSGKTDEEGTAQSIDIDGEVGHPLYVSNPRARCEDVNGNAADWFLAPSIVSGTLPPGMTLDSKTSQINGLPTERGHWIVKMHSGTLTCNGSPYMGFPQELRFHITGTGKVVQ